MSVSNGVPTVDDVGDEALATSIIDRSITDIYDNVCDNIGDYAFTGCSKLTTVIFPMASSVYSNAFSDCSALHTLDYLGGSSIGMYAFSGCSNLTALIIRNENRCSSFGTSFLSGTPIEKGTGYIYVPSALVDSYKTASGWSTYADQIRAIEDYPLICDPYTWPAVFSAIDAGTYKDYYSIGDCVPLDLGSEGIIDMQIVAFDTDDLADGSGKAPITWVAKILPKTKYRMNPALASTTKSGVTIYTEGTGNIGGWEKSEMRNTHIPALAAMVPENVRARVVKVKKTQLASDSSGARVSQTTEDEYFIPSMVELSTGGAYESCYPNLEDRKKYKADGSYISRYWSRDITQYGDDTKNFWAIGNSDGCATNTESSERCGVPLSFCT